MISRFDASRPLALPKGVIFEIARAGNLAAPDDGREKWPVPCPFHSDARASAVLFAVSNVLYCSAGCGTFTAKAVAQRLGVDFAEAIRRIRAGGPSRVSICADDPQRGAVDPALDIALVREVWEESQKRARNDDAVARERDVYACLRQRRLHPACHDLEFGILPPGLPEPFDAWYGSGHRIVLPLHDVATGDVVNVQARCIRASRMKTRVPTGSRVTGTVFANRAGVDLLRGSSRTGQCVIFGEGLTDSIALGFLAGGPILAAPGTGAAKNAIGAWARDQVIVLALDTDESGDRAIGPTADAAYRHGASRVFRLRWPKGLKDICELHETRDTDATIDLLNRHLLVANGASR